MAAVQSVADGRRDNRSAGLESPQHVAGFCVECDQVALCVAGEHQAASRRKNTAGGSADGVEVPNHVAGFWIERENASAARLAPANGAGLIPLPLDELLAGFVEEHAALTRSEIVKPRLRTIRGGLPIVPTAHSRTRAVAFFSGVLTGYGDGAAVRRNAIGPGDFRVRFGLQQFSIGAIEQVEKSIPVGLHERLYRAAIQGHVYWNRIRHRVPIVHIVRRELVVPLEFSCVGVERHNAA